MIKGNESSVITLMSDKKGNITGLLKSSLPQLSRSSQFTVDGQVHIAYRGRSDIVLGNQYHCLDKTLTMA